MTVLQPKLSLCLSPLSSLLELRILRALPNELLLQDFYSFSAAVLGHAASENEEVDQTKSGGQQGELY